jgi:hypothetical protein
MVYPICKLEYFYILSSDEFEDKVITYRVLSKKELLQLQNKYYDENSPTNNLFKLNVVKLSVIDFDVDYLSDNVIEDLFTEIMKVSKVTNELLKDLQHSFDITNDEKLKGDTWNCEVCKGRNLQYSRNCPFLKDKSKCDTSFQILIQGELYTECPIGLVNQELLQAGYDCYFMYSKGHLPEIGGMYDQTEFFNMVAISMFGWLKAYESEAMKMENDI